MSDDPTGERFWTREMYRELAARNEDVAFRATKNVIRLTEALERLAREAEGRGAWEAANRARAVIAETRAQTARTLKGDGRSVPFIARKLRVTERRVRDYLSASEKAGKQPDVSG